MAKLKLKKRSAKSLSSTAKKADNLPAVSADGQLMVAAGKYARNAVLTVFHDIGGTGAMAEWAEKNKTDFYTKMFAKTITREVEHDRKDTIEDLIEAAQKKRDEQTKKEAIDAEFEEV